MTPLCQDENPHSAGVCVPVSVPENTLASATSSYGSLLEQPGYLRVAPESVGPSGMVQNLHRRHVRM